MLTVKPVYMNLITLQRILVMHFRHLIMGLWYVIHGSTDYNVRCNALDNMTYRLERLGLMELHSLDCSPAQKLRVHMVHLIQFLDAHVCYYDDFTISLFLSIITCILICQSYFPKPFQHNKNMSLEKFTYLFRASKTRNDQCSWRFLLLYG